MIPEHKDGEWLILEQIRNNKYKIALATFLLVLLLHIIDIIVERKSIPKSWVKQFLHQIVDLDLGGNNYHTRVSILRVKKGYSIIIRQLFYLFIIRFFENFKERTWIQSIRQIPIHLFSDYLYIYQRYSFPREKKSYTCFRVKERNGVAVKCYREGVDCEIVTSCISDIKLPSKFKDLSSVNKKRVKKYMQDSYIAEDNYITLLSMVKRANNIYATPIINEHQQVWGVLIIDNDENQIVSFKKIIEPVIERYIKMFVYTISHLKEK